MISADELALLIKATLAEHAKGPDYTLVWVFAFFALLSGIEHAAAWLGLAWRLAWAQLQARFSAGAELELKQSSL
jgi:hypothetical protein